MLPEIVEAATQGIAGANLTVLNGADGLGEVLTGLVGQGLSIYESLRKSIAPTLPRTDDHQPENSESNGASTALTSTSRV